MGAAAEREQHGSLPNTRHHHQPASTEQYAAELLRLAKQFDERFDDLKQQESALQLFARPFHVQSAPAYVQMELLELQAIDDLRAKYRTESLIEFYKLYATNTDFPNIQKHAINIASLFGSTYTCERFF